jgi:cytochrome oxidase Cu insertion factor (SCO1/SenC/PrrC family)
MRVHIAGMIAAVVIVFSSSPASLAQEKAPPPKPGIGIGDEAPDFTLKDHNLEDVTLSEFLGKKKVILAFYVFAFTGG